MRLKCIFTNTENDAMRNVALLLLRMLVGGLLLSHGISKLMNFETMSPTFFDPLGVGSKASLSLVIFAEVGCSILVITGFFARLACLPIIFNMGVAAFVFHDKDPFQVKELALLFLGLFIVIFLTGPGKFALDSLMKDCPWYKE